MTLHLANIAFDCDDAHAVARFWSAAIDRPLDSDPAPSLYFASIGMKDDSQTSWLFMKVPEKKTVKNRVHVDFTADDQEEKEIARLVDLGAKRIADKEEWGHSWTVLQDPEGNEFCVAEM